MSSPSKIVGIIAEDKSDVESVKVILNRLKETNVKVEYFVGKGCGKIKKKCQSWAGVLKTKGCSSLILIHDLDRNDLKELNNGLLESLLPSPIPKYVISIPIEEMEAWLIADIDCIKKYFNIAKGASIKGTPESIISPKEKIEEMVWLRSGKEKQYLNTEHNSKLFEIADLDKIIKKCPSFSLLNTFIATI